MLVSKYQKQKELGPINWFASEILDFDIRNHTQKNFEKKTWKDKEKTNLKIYKNEKTKRFHLLEKNNSVIQQYRKYHTN